MLNCTTKCRNPKHAFCGNHKRSKTAMTFYNENPFHPQSLEILPPPTPQPCQYPGCEMPLHPTHAFCDNHSISKEALYFYNSNPTHPQAVEYRAFLAQPPPAIPIPCQFEGCETPLHQPHVFCHEHWNNNKARVFYAANPTHPQAVEYHTTHSKHKCPPELCERCPLKGHVYCHRHWMDLSALGRKRGPRYTGALQRTRCSCPKVCVIHCFLLMCTRHDAHGCI